MLDVAKTLKRITPSEIQIVQARSEPQTKSFRFLSDSDKKIILHEILIEGTALYGFPIPETSSLIGSIKETVNRSISLHGFKDYNEKEFLLALHLNSAPITHLPKDVDIEIVNPTGTHFNAFFYVKILKNYSAIRRSLDAKAKNIVNGRAEDGGFLTA